MAMKYFPAMKQVFGLWLESKRGRRGEPGFVSQRELARRMAVDPTYVSQLEKRSTPPSYETRQRIHAALGTTESELIDLGIVPPVGQAPATFDQLTHDDGTAAAFIASLTSEQRGMLLHLLRAADTTIHIDDARPEPGNAAVRSIS